MKEIQLTRGKVTFVDDEDYDRLMEHKWAWVPSTGSLTGEGYAVRKGNKKRGEPRTVQMHREILNAPKGRVVDHRNIHSLDNQKSNLRYADLQTNSFNRNKTAVPCTSCYKGVFMRSKVKDPTRPWTARIRFNGRRVELGIYENQKDAAAAYNLASRILFGEYRHENRNVGELCSRDMERVLNIIERYIEKYGWRVDTEAYRFFYTDSDKDRMIMWFYDDEPDFIGDDRCLTSSKA